MLRRIGALALALMLAALPASAQVNRQTSTNVSSTIAVTNTFQQVLARQDGRSGCTIVNYGTNTMWVFFGPIASATKAASIQIDNKIPTYCQFGGVVLVDQVSITGTAGDAFFAASQP